MTDEPPQSVEVAYVLGGNAVDRGEFAAELYHNNFFDKVVCVGGNTHNVLAYYNISEVGAEVTTSVLLENKVSSSDIKMIRKGTSTIEEFDFIAANIRKHGYKKVMIITDKFHTRRVEIFLIKKLERLGCRVVLVGAPSSLYNEQKWWETEEGFLFVFKEYLKIIYYGLF